MFNFDLLMSESTFLPAPVFTLNGYHRKTKNFTERRASVSVSDEVCLRVLMTLLLTSTFTQQLLISLFNLPQQILLDMNIYIYINAN